ncbi:MAG TPA: RagB/SusD family nutrient uptake outer membrane protein [Flavisolibacter sp.]
MKTMHNTMSNIKLKSILFIVAVFTFLPSCKKYLEKQPDNRAVLDTPEKVSQLLATAYPGANYVPFTETSTDNVGDIGSGDVGSPDLNVINSDVYFFKDTRTTGEDTPEFYWFACYHAIAASNEALKTISNVSNPNDYVAQKAEALVTRAYAHFMLVNIFAKFYDPATASSDPGIPYVTEPEENFIKQYSRGTVASVYANIEQDLLAGLPYLDNKSYSVPKYHFTKSAANAFAARFYLYKKDYQKVIQYASQAVPNNDFLSNLRPWNTEYSQILLNEIAPRYAKATENANLLLCETNSYWFRTNAFARYAMTPAVRDQVLRYEPVTGGQWAFATGSYVENHIIVPKINEYFVRVSVNADFGNGYVMVPLFTVEEVLFNLAEAYAYTNQFNNAIALLNTYLSTRIVAYDPSRHGLNASNIQNAWGTSNTQLALINTILSYRRTEFVHEGLRWFDILRYKIPVVHRTLSGQTYTLSPTDPHRLFQIPATAKQSGIDQNPR